LNARGDLHRAAELASIYLAAGLHRNARAELVAAQRLAPSDDTILELLKKVP